MTRAITSYRVRGDSANRCCLTPSPKCSTATKSCSKAFGSTKSRRRVDAILELDDKIYVMEFKYVKCPKDASDDKKKKLFETILEDAMKQINNKGYCDKYMGSCKVIYKAAFAFLGRDDIEMKVEN